MSAIIKVYDKINDLIYDQRQKLSSDNVKERLVAKEVIKVLDGITDFAWSLRGQEQKEQKESQDLLEDKLSVIRNMTVQELAEWLNPTCYGPTAG